MRGKQTEEKKGVGQGRAEQQRHRDKILGVETQWVLEHTSILKCFAAVY
jgi:hypothetical protein